MAVYSGKGGLCYASSSAAGAAAAVLKLTQWNLDQSTSKDDATTFTDTNKVYVEGIPDMVGSLAGFWDDTDDSLYDASRSADGVRMYLYPSKLTLAKYFYGPAIIDFNITTPVAGPIAVGGDFAANGVWGQF